MNLKNLSFIFIFFITKNIFSCETFNQEQKRLENLINNLERQSAEAEELSLKAKNLYRNSIPTYNDFGAALNMITIGYLYKLSGEKYMEAGDYTKAANNYSQSSYMYCIAAKIYKKLLQPFYAKNCLEASIYLNILSRSIYEDEYLYDNAGEQNNLAAQKIPLMNRLIIDSRNSQNLLAEDSSICIFDR